MVDRAKRGQRSSQLRARWATTEGKTLAAEVLRRIRSDTPLDDLPIARFNDRVDLRGISFSRPTLSPYPSPLPHLDLTEVQGTIKLEGTRLRNLDLSHASLESMRFIGCEIDDCMFAEANCRDWRLWSTSVKSSSFEGAKLRDASLGAWHNKRADTYEQCSFRRSDLRGAVCTDGAFTECDFSEAQLVKLDFGGTNFVRCRFAGELREVIFWSRASQTQMATPNMMQQVDFRAAELRWVEFRLIDVQNLIPPEGANHLIIKNPARVLRSALDALGSSSAPGDRGLLGALQVYLRWLSPTTDYTVLNRLDLGANERERHRAVELLRRLEARCT